MRVLASPLRLAGKGVGVGGMLFPGLAIIHHQLHLEPESLVLVDMGSQQITEPSANIERIAPGVIQGVLVYLPVPIHRP